MFVLLIFMNMHYIIEAMVVPFTVSGTSELLVLSSCYSIFYAGMG